MISSGHDRRVKKIIFNIPAQADVRPIDRETAMRICTPGFTIQNAVASLLHGCLD
jgi:hypothetical protein